jgi:hypothetical protein
VATPEDDDTGMEPPASVADVVPSAEPPAAGLADAMMALVAEHASPPPDRSHATDEPTPETSANGLQRADGAPTAHLDPDVGEPPAQAFPQFVAAPAPEVHESPQSTEPQPAHRRWFNR